MAFTRPVVGADISAADFGQPVYDGIIRAGFSRYTTTAPSSGTTPTAIALPSVWESAGNAFTANGANTIFTCAIAGVYAISVHGFAGNQLMPAGTFIGIHVDGIMRNRSFQHVVQAQTVAYATVVAQIVCPLAVGQTVSYVIGAGSGTFTWGTVPVPGYASDGVAPLLNVWRVSV